MSKTIGQLKTIITSRLHGTTLNKISDFYTICQDASEMVLSRIDPQETVRKALLANAVYDRVYDYQLPTDFKSPQNLTPQANGDSINNSSLSRTYTRQFGNQRKDNQMAIVWQDGVQFMRFAKYLNTPVTLDKADSLTENGTWTVGGNASGLEVDTLNYVAGTGSLKCAVSSPGAIVNVILRVGNDSSNYLEKTVTTGHFDAFTTGWNLNRFDLSSATTTGTVDMTAIDYLRVTVTYNTNQTAYYEKTLTEAVDLSDNYDTDGAVFLYTYFGSVTSLSVLRLDNIVAARGTLYNLGYYSNYLFRNTSGTWISKPTSDSDIINLSPVSYKIFEAEVSRIIAQQVQGAMGIFDYTYWNAMLEGDNEDNNDRRQGLYDRYMAQFPSERIEGAVDYYNTQSDDESGVNGGGNTPNGQPLSYWS